MNPPIQMTFEDAERAKSEAMRRVESNAEDYCPTFKEMACLFAVKFLAQNGPHSSEDISIACMAAGIVPHDQRAFGPVYGALSAQGKIVRAGYCQRKKGHNTSGGIIWMAA